MLNQRKESYILGKKINKELNVKSAVLLKKEKLIKFGKSTDFDNYGKNEHLVNIDNVFQSSPVCI